MSDIKALIKDHVTEELQNIRPPQFHAIPASALRDIMNGGGQDILLPRAESVLEIFASLAEVSYSARALNDFLVAFLLELEEEDSDMLENLLPKVKERLANAREAEQEANKKREEEQKRKQSVLRPQSGIILPQ